MSKTETKSTVLLKHHLKALLTDEQCIHGSRRRFPVALRRQAMNGLFKPQ